MSGVGLWGSSTVAFVSTWLSWVSWVLEAAALRQAFWRANVMAERLRLLASACGRQLRRSARGADSLALLGLGARVETPAVRCAHCGRTIDASQSWKRACSAPPPSLRCSAPQMAAQAEAGGKADTTRCPEDRRHQWHQWHQWHQSSAASKAPDAPVALDAFKHTACRTTGLAKARAGGPQGRLCAAEKRRGLGPRALARHPL